MRSQSECRGMPAHRRSVHDKGTRKRRDRRGRHALFAAVHQTHTQTSRRTIKAVPDTEGETDREPSLSQSTQERLLHNAQHHPRQTGRRVLNGNRNTIENGFGSRRLYRNHQKADEQDVLILNVPIITTNRSMTQATGAPTVVRAICRLLRGGAIFADMMTATALRSGVFSRSIRKHPHAPERADQEGENDSDRVKRTKHGSFSA